MFLDDLILPVVASFLKANITELNTYDVACSVDQTVFAERGNKKFINVFPASTLNGETHIDQEGGFDFTYGFNIGVTFRHPNIPPDRMWTRFMEDEDGPVKMVRRIVHLMRCARETLLCNVNNAIDGDDVALWQLVEPFRLANGVADFTEVGPAHFNADPNGRDNRGFYGLWTVLQYSHGRIMASCADAAVPDPDPDPDPDGAAYDQGFSTAFDIVVP